MWDLVQHVANRNKTYCNVASKGCTFAAFSDQALVEMEILIFPNCQLSLCYDQ